MMIWMKWGQSSPSVHWVPTVADTGNDPSRTKPFNNHNGFKELIHLAMLWTVQYRCMAGVRFDFNCYKHWAQMLLRCPGKEPGISIRLLGVTQCDPLSMILYGIPLVPLV